MHTLTTRFVRVGNSRGLRIPKAVIEQLGFGSEVEIAVLEDSLVIRPAGRRRSGWEQKFLEMAAHGDDSLLDGHTATEWEKDDWEW
ncbi:MAG: AbrB/MazE/SpoVT family DNA-binding domain-containing protein [Candidatus Hydrogenedentes bacterium]|nr:AbrB/MazE/SpoVT family DNA-binding domain-containing protein [Candidatus Hydrogenedentota bacterium]